MQFEAWGWLSPAKRLENGVQRYYRAVWSGPVLACQRLALAQQVSGLLVISRPGSSHQADKWLPKSYVVGMSQVEDPELLQVYYQQSAVGLVTSLLGGEEAVCEYQLCGLPVVTTACLDRRTECVDPRFLRIVPDDPLSISLAVDEVFRRRYDPREIRESFLSRWHQSKLGSLHAGFSGFLPIGNRGRYRPRRVPETGCRVLGNGTAAARAMPAFRRLPGAV